MSDVARGKIARIKRVDEAKRIVYGEVYAPWEIDTYGEFMTPDDIEIMAERFMRLDLANVIDTNHDNEPNGSYPVQSFIARADDPDFGEGSWVLGVKVPEDEIWDMVVRGELNAFSFEAMVKAVDVEVQLSVFRDHVGATEPGGIDGHMHMFFVQLNPDGQVVGGQTSFDEGHRHKILRASITQVSGGHLHRYFL